MVIQLFCVLTKFPNILNFLINILQKLTQHFLLEKDTTTKYWAASSDDGATAHGSAQRRG
jgi:hypothetical protein